MVKERDFGIDLLKFFAVLLITNSHFDILYSKYAYLATGGAIGDALFFFCSGFSLFLSQNANGIKFFNWYKKRINRIYPTVFAWAILSAFLFSNSQTMDKVVIYGGGWFVTCIMVYYVIFFFVKKYMQDKLNLVMVISLAVVVLWYCLYDRSPEFNMYQGFFKQVHYFLFMLLGGMLGSMRKRMELKFSKDLVLLLFSVMAYYGYLYMGSGVPVIHELQILSLIPLGGVVYYAYKVSKSAQLSILYENKVVGPIVKVVGGLSLEIYIVQFCIIRVFEQRSASVVNLLLVSISILFLAYVLRCLSRLFSQTFREGDYDWKSVVRLY